MTPDTITDVNITIGQWPTRRVPCDDIETLVAKLREHGVTEAWVGSFDGLFHDDLAGVNDRLANACRDPSAVRFLPFGAINPATENWKRDFERCTGQLGMKGVRLHPNYHGYKLDHPSFAELVKLAANAQIVVQLVVLMEDERMMHPLMRVPPVDLSPLPTIIEQTPGVRLVLLNALRGRRDETLVRLLNLPGVYCDIAMLEGVGALENVVTDVLPEKLLFGSHTPCLYFESALLKLQESAIPQPHRRAIREISAHRLIHS